MISVFKNMDLKQQFHNLWMLLKTIRGRWPLYTLGLAGVAIQMLAFNYIMSRSLKGLSEAAITLNMDILIDTLTTLGLGILIVTILMPFFTYAFESSTRIMTGNIRKKLFHHIQWLPVAYLENSHSGDMLSRLTNDIQAAENAYGWHLGILVMSVVSGLGSAVIIFSVDARLGLMAVAIGIMNFLVNTVFVKPLKLVSEAIQQRLSEANQRLSDIIAGSQTVKIYNLAGIMTKKYVKASLGIRFSALKRTVYQSLLSSLNWFFVMMSFIGMVLFGSIMVINDTLEFPQLMMAVQMMNGIIWMFSGIGGYIAQLQGSLAGAARIFDILNQPIEPDADNDERLHLQTSSEGTAVIRFEDVSFAYEGDDTVLNSFCGDMMKNETVALVGLSGSGKSTLFKLLLGFYKQSSGRIQLYGHDIAEYSLKELRSLTSYVPQDSYLFSGTISENIAYGRRGSTKQEIIDAAKSAYAHDFIISLPEGYDTQVGERGARLSGGQRQRIAIARAILKDAPILLLDEATASLDSESEQQVQKALAVLMNGRTTIAAAHRLSTIQHADKILVMEEGRITEQGVHSSLLASGRTYARLYNLQFKSLSPDADVREAAAGHES